VIAIFVINGKVGITNGFDFKEIKIK